MKKHIFILAVLLVFLSQQALAGWVEVSKYGGTTYISNGKVAQVPDGKDKPWSIFDANKGTITMVKPAIKSYIEINPKELCKEMTSLMEQMTARMPPEERAMMEETRKRPGATESAPLVTVALVGNGGKIAGIDTVKYSVKVDGRPYKDVWFATNASIMEDVGEFMKDVMGMHKLIEGCTQAGAGPVGTNPELSEEYLGLMEKGWTMREVNMLDKRIVSEVESLEKREIPASEFTVPAGYRLIDMKEMMSGPGK